jgi:hypothetical protein
MQTCHYPNCQNNCFYDRNRRVFSPACSRGHLNLGQIQQPIAQQGQPICHYPGCQKACYYGNEKFSLACSFRHL